MISNMAGFLGDKPVLVVVVVFALILLEILMMLFYKRKSVEADLRPVIGPIHFRGTFPAGFKESGLGSLTSELDDINSTYKEMAKEFDMGDSPVEHGKEFCTMITLSSMALNLDPSEHPKDYLLLSGHLEKINVKTNKVEAPLHAIVNVFLWIIYRIPAPYRSKFVRKQLNVIIVSSTDEYKITVYRKTRFTGQPSNSDLLQGKLTRRISKSENESEPFRQIAFMILELHGKAFKGLNWRGMMHFTDGIVNLTKYMKRPDSKLLLQAKSDFENSIKADNCEYEARCFLGALLVAERKNESVDRAIGVFKAALETDRPKFRAFVHAGLAHCYSQQYHRLAKRTSEVIGKAREHAGKASQLWNEIEDNPQPWIQYTLAITMIIDEGVDITTSDKMKNHFIPAINLCYEAIGGDERNKLFYNTIGWMFLKLTENRILELKVEDEISETLAGIVPEKAEYYLKKSLEFDKRNKLSNANLCLLYSTPYFQQKSKDSLVPEQYLNYCRSYGKRAVKIDPDYINGYRDLAVGMIKYGLFDEAYEYYLNALDKALTEEKDHEIMEDILKLLMEVSASQKIVKKFQNPPESVLTPNKSGKK